MEIENNNPHKNKVHRVLAYSYSVQFVLFLLGLYFDLVFALKIPTYPLIAQLGIFLLILGSFLIFWAQLTTHDFKKENMSQETFCQGPYRYTRSPTHFGLFLLMLGFGLMISAPLVISFTVLSFIISKLVFLKRQEEILAEKYGTPYLEYKKFVKF